jgi:hypothetical protein
MPGIEAPIHLVEQLQESQFWRVWTISNMGCGGGSRPMIKTFFPFPLQARTFLGTLSGTDAK